MMTTPEPDPDSNLSDAFIYPGMEDYGDGEFRCEASTPVAIPVLIVLLSVVGLVANTIVIFIVTVLREYQKSVTNIYVLQLAMADFIFLFQLPFHAQTMISGEWTYGVAWCKISEAIKMLNYYSSILFLTIMSVDRYLAINFAMNQRAMRFRTKRAASIISCCLWGLSVVSVINILIYADVHECGCQIYFPVDRSNILQNYSDYNFGSADFGPTDYPFGTGYADNINGNALQAATDYPFGTGYADNINGNALQAFVDMYNNDDTVCSFAKPQYSQYFKTWIVCNFVLAFLVPLLVISLSYALIVKRILRPMVIGTKSQQSNRTRKRVTVMVTALVSTFIACWLPYHAFNLARLNDVRMFAQACENITNFTIVLAYSNSAVNPFFYTFLGTNFRKRWGNAVGKARKGIRQSILSHSGEYIPGSSFKGRRKSSAASTSTVKNRDDMSVNSFATKHTIVPLNQGFKEEKL